MSSSASATRILQELGEGDSSAARDLLPLVYEELRSLAAGYMQRERANHTLQPTALAHEAYLRLVDESQVGWQGRAHFFAVAAEMIRRILVDHARRRMADKRGGGAARVEIEVEPEVDGDRAHPIDLLALEEALEELGRLNDRHRRIVELRYFVGLTVVETAHVLGVSKETVKADWRMARAWLRSRLSTED